MMRMGLQSLPSSKQPTSEAKKDENESSTDDFFLASEPIFSSDPRNDRQPPTTADYKSWLKEHPSALSSFEDLVKAAKGKMIIVILDYDGTLSPIVDDPDRAFMSDEMRAAVHKVAKNYPTAIITGRRRDKVKEFVKLNNVCYAGSHGMDILTRKRQQKLTDTDMCQTMPIGKTGQEILFQPAEKFLPSIQEILRALEEETRNIKGARVEDNLFCISVHYRQVSEEDYEIVESKVKSILKNYPEFRLSTGKQVFEIKPSIEWNKGNALEYFLINLGFDNSRNVVPLYIGDDQTDEDAFKVLRNKGQGYPIIVSSVPVETKAAYSLQDPSEVLSFLIRLAKAKKIFTSGSRVINSAV